MRIYQNISALNAYRNLSTTEGRLNKSLERLSSGLRINRAADDAAGLAISEKMRAQIRGLNQAIRNAQDGISLIQTAEGALNETHAILQRMRELAVQAATGTNTSQDRMEIQREIDQLKDEIDRIGNTTEFNTKKLLDGTTSALTSTDKLTTKVYMRDGLRIIDQFGQKAAGGGNYKIEITPDPGKGQVQKTDIMKIKHGTAYTYNTDSGITAISNENLRYGSYTVATSAGDTVAGAAVNVINTMFMSGTGALTLEAFTGNETLSGSFGVKITNVNYADETIDFEVTYRLYTSTGGVTAGTDTFENYSIGATGNDTFNILRSASGTTAALTFEFSGNSMDVYSVNDVAVYSVDMGNSNATAAITVDSVSLDSGGYVTNINGTDYTAHSANSTTISLEAGFWNDTITEFEVVQIDAAGNLSTGTVNVTLENIGDATDAVTFNYQGEIGQRATLDSTLDQLDRFWDASGNFILENPQTLTLVQGDGAKANVTIFRSDTIYGLQQKLNAAIGNARSYAGTIETGKGLGQSELEGVGTDYTRFVQYVTQRAADEAAGDGFMSVQGTFIIQSAITGKAGEIYFVGNDNIIDALSLTTIQESEENNFTISVFDAHDRSKVVAQNVVINGNVLVGVVHANVDVEFHNNTGINTVWNETTKQWEWREIDPDNPEVTYVHLADNTSVFHIGANPLQDVTASIGDMRAAALGVDNILVTSRDLANSAIAKLDLAIGRVSSERSKMGALQNRLEHTISNLSVAAENLSASESRIRDLDMAKEMMEFTKNQILMQAGTAMLSQANMKPQMVLQLLGG